MTFDRQAAALRAARERADIARAIQDAVLHTAVYDAREQGMTPRGAATMLDVPRKVLARHWREGHRCDDEPPVWGSERPDVEAWNAIWAHDPTEQITTSPWVWGNLADGTRIVRRRTTGRALLRVAGASGRDAARIGE